MYYYYIRILIDILDKHMLKVLQSESFQHVWK